VEYFPYKGLFLNCESCILTYTFATKSNAVIENRADILYVT